MAKLMKVSDQLAHILVLHDGKGRLDPEDKPCWFVKKVFSLKALTRYQRRLDQDSNCRRRRRRTELSVRSKIHGRRDKDHTRDPNQ